MTRVTPKSRFVLREGIKFDCAMPLQAACLDDIGDAARHLRTLVSRTIETVSSIFTPTYRFSTSRGHRDALAYAEACREGIPGLPSGDFIMPLNRVLPASQPLRFAWTKRAIAIMYEVVEESRNGDLAWIGIDRIIQQRLLPEELSISAIATKRHTEGLIMRIGKRAP